MERSILMIWLLVAHHSTQERLIMIEITKRLYVRFTNLFQVIASARELPIDPSAEGVMNTALRLNSSIPGSISSMLPNISCQYIRRNSSLLENLLPHFQNSDEMDGPAKPVKYNKFIFRDICTKLGIINEKHYQECLKDSKQLQECEIAMNPTQLEGYKKLIFVHNFKKQLQDFQWSPIFEIRDRNRLGIWCRFLKTISIENNINFDTLIEHLARWYFVRNHKKFGLLCFGATNSGKTLLADLLCSQYRDWEIGAFSCPPGTIVSLFHLDALLNTFIYRCDEIIFENLSIVQRMKNLLEGSRLMDTHVKYKSK